MTIAKVRNILSFRWVAGPILGKELRILSRLKRSYLLRALYLLVLMLFMSLLWFDVTRTSSYSLLQASRMSEAAEGIIIGIVWFQFIAAQILALILCSTAINQELVQRTLPTLMTTPITSFQIIMGKLVSRLWQIAVLLAVSLPLLAMVRVFGGIPWMYVVAALSITLSVVVFISVVTTFFSILFRRAYAVIIASTAALALLFAAIPFAIFLLGETFDQSLAVYNWLTDELPLYINPYLFMVQMTNALARSTLGSSFFAYWPIQCLILASLSAIFLAASCRMVRPVALRHLVPKTRRKEYAMPPRESRTYWLYRPFFLHAMVRATIGTGMVWKEFLQPVLGRYRKVVFIFLILVVTGFVIAGLMALSTGDLEVFGMVITGSVSGFLMLSVLFTLIIPAAAITAEKEAGTWLVLLTTCYSDYRILGGKLVGIARRIIIVWSPAVFIFVLVAYVSDVPFLLWCFLAAQFTLAGAFIAASGLYFSSRFKRSNTAAICNIVLIAILWLAIPLLLSMLKDFFYEFDYAWNQLNIAQAYLRLIPPGAIGEILSRPAGPRPQSILLAFWPASKGYIISHSLAIALFLWRAKANLRKRII